MQGAKILVLGRDASRKGRFRLCSVFSNINPADITIGVPLCKTTESHKDLPVIMNLPEQDTPE